MLERSIYLKEGETGIDGLLESKQSDSAQVSMSLKTGRYFWSLLSWISIQFQPIQDMAVIPRFNIQTATMADNHKQARKGRLLSLPLNEVTPMLDISALSANIQ